MKRKRIHRTAVWGLLWLAFCAAASATPVSTPFTIATYNFSVEDGGGFSAYLNGNSANTFEVYCVDFQNYVYPPNDTYDVYVDDVGVTVADTRYGTTPTTGFTDQVMINGSPVDAQVRYILAGWLTTHYDLNPTTTAENNQNLGIQNAIWTLLDTGSDSAFASSYEATWLGNALSWATSEGSAGLQNYAHDVEVFTSTSVSSTPIPGRYTTGQQEMITVIPEPAATALVGIGLIALGLLRRKLV
jgi:hypothetical protein